MHDYYIHIHIARAAHGAPCAARAICIYIYIYIGGPVRSEAQLGGDPGKLWDARR